ncbi:hypothetical protein TNCV_1909691 [Trichonephila clavipes]|nr:hypothetical protein TNCV_1909691 [Trichonephila clavipes]
MPLTRTKLGYFTAPYPIKLPSGQGIGSWQACYEFDPSTTEDPPSTRELLVRNLVHLNQYQVTKTTPELSPSPPHFPTTPTGRYLSLDIFNVHRPPLHGRPSAVLGSNS